MKKHDRSIVVRMLIAMLASFCLVGGCFGLVGCQREETNDNYYGGDYDYSTSITKSEAISIAKGSSEVHNEIAKKFGMKFFYVPDWGTVTAEEEYGGSWKVTLKGTISGYTDDYKSDFEYDKKFTAYVTVSTSGYVGSIYVSTY